MTPKQLISKYFPENDTSRKWITVNCPFCPEGDFNQKLGINIAKDHVHCFRCEYNATLKWFFKELEVSGPIDYTREQKVQSRTSKPIVLPDEFIWCGDLIPNTTYTLNKVQYLINDFLDYIDKRIGLSLARRLGVGCCLYGKYAFRILIPSFSKDKIPNYFVARAIKPLTRFLKNKRTGLIEEVPAPKVLNPSGDKEAIYNFYESIEFQEIYLTEGVFGAISMYPYGAALYGKECNESQLWELVRSRIKILNIMLDGNALSTAYKLADRILDLTNKIKIRIVELREDLQPDDLPFNYKLELTKNTAFYRRFCNKL